MAAPAFQRAGGGISDAMSSAQSSLTGMGAFWGRAANDKAAQTFGATYKPAQDQLLEVIAIVAGSVSGVSDAINQMATNYGVSEQVNVNKMHAVQQEMQ
jgi:hypothetical protein